MTAWDVKITSAQDTYSPGALIVDLSRGDDLVRFTAERSSSNKSGWSLSDANAGGRQVDRATMSSARRAAVKALNMPGALDQTLGAVEAPRVPAPSPTPYAEVVSERTWNAGQAWNHELVLAAGGERLRIAVRNNAYAEQSWGRAEVWRESGWTEVHRIPGRDLWCREGANYVRKDVDFSEFIDDVLELARVAAAVLGLDLELVNEVIL